VSPGKSPPAPCRGRSSTAAEREQDNRIAGTSFAMTRLVTSDGVCMTASVERVDSQLGQAHP